MSSPKGEVITFKADSELAELLKKIPNKSDFIRQAVLSQLDNVCPLCQGIGVLSPAQKRHWDDFAKHHRVERCDSCDEYYLSCEV
jgi:hypothetical protein